MAENDRIRILVGKGKYKYVTYDDIFNDSDSGNDYCSDDDEDFAAIATNINENLINNIIVDDNTEPEETNIVNKPTDDSANDDELFRLLENFDKICSDPNVLPDATIPSNGKINTPLTMHGIYSSYHSQEFFFQIHLKIIILASLMVIILRIIMIQHLQYENFDLEQRQTCRRYQIFPHNHLRVQVTLLVWRKCQHQYLQVENEKVDQFYEKDRHRHRIVRQI